MSNTILCSSRGAGMEEILPPDTTISVYRGGRLDRLKNEAKFLIPPPNGPCKRRKHIYRQLRISRIFWAAQKTSTYPKFELCVSRIISTYVEISYDHSRRLRSYSVLVRAHLQQ